MGLDNLWHDIDVNGNEVGAGASPMWHNKNLEFGILGDYLEYYGLGDAELSGTYVRNYSDDMKAPWLWNSDTSVFLSTEDEQSIDAKAQYVIDEGIGGIMFWELAGDYGFNEEKGQYEIGYTMTDLMASKFTGAAPYGNKIAEIDMPTETIDLSVTVNNFQLGDMNYPIVPDIVFTNNTEVDIPGGTEFFFDISTSAPANMAVQDGGKMTLITDGSNATQGNFGGLENNFHRIKVTMPAFDSMPPGGSWRFALKYFLPVSMPSNWVVTFGEKELALKQEHPFLPAADLTIINTCPDGLDISSLNEAPNWLNLGWNGEPTNASAGQMYTYEGEIWLAKGWVATLPVYTDQWGEWEKVCAIPVVEE
jgi:chitinase